MGRVAEKATLYLDGDSIRWKADSASLWLKYVDDEKGSFVDHAQIRRETHQFRILSSVHYGDAGNVLDSRDWGESGPWNDIPPDSVIDYIYKAVF